MPLFGIAAVFLGAVFAELQGNKRTRGFTRFAFVLVCLLEAGLSFDGLSSSLYDVIGVIA